MIELESMKTRISAPAHPSATGGRVSGLVSTFAILRFGEGIRQAEADRHERDERAREEAAERLKYLFVDANNNNIKGKDRNETTFQRARPTF